jgi:hypothetical protein
MPVRFTQRFAWLSVAVLVGCMAGSAGRQVCVAAEGPAVEPLVPANGGAVAARRKALADKAPKGASLVAYLDCGTQRESAGGKVKIACTSGRPYQFPGAAPAGTATQTTVFFDNERVVFAISGLDRTHRYLAGLSWWDFDNGSRTQSVIVGSPDERLVRLAVPAIRLPNYKDDKQLPAERRFQLPVVFSQDGKLRLAVERVDGANAVISELWIWQLD